MTLIPIDDDDVAAGRALRAEFARFWSTEQGDPRTVYDRFIATTPVAADVAVQHVSTDPGPGIWVRPAEALPDRVLLFLHGGGYGLGSAPAYAGLVSQIAVRTRAAVFALDYPLAPESQLPEALDVAVATLTELNRDHATVAIVGDSAGGGLSLATAAQAGREGIDVAAVTVFSPWTDLSLSGASVRAHAVGDPLLDPAYLRSSAAAYLGAAATDDPRASPLFGALDGFPPLLIQVGSDEILLDDSRRFADSVERAGGTVTLEVWQGMHHVFQLNVVQLVSARRALDRAGEFLSGHLGRRLAPTGTATDSSLRECIMATSTAPQLVRFADCKPEPWANGGGVTRVIAKGQFDGGSAGFDWRLSVADVSTSGAFSKLPGVDRVIILTDGPGLLLTVDGHEHELEPFHPLPFVGEASTECQVAEPTRDFNVMTRRGVCAATVDILARSETLVPPGDSITYVISLKGQAEVRLSSGTVNLDQFDAVLLTVGAEVRVGEAGRAAVVRIEAVA